MREPLLSLDALRAIISNAASHSPEFSLMHVNVSRAYLHAKARRTVLVKLPSRRVLRKGHRGNRTAEEEHVRHQRCSK